MESNTVNNMTVNLPYFDVVLEKFNQGDPEMLELFGRHLHYGYWEDPTLADGSEADFVRAAENLCQRIFNVAGVKEGLRILDVGCGFGGTIASINERYNGVELVGLNIDRRQLERAKQQVQARSGNSIEFVEGNACELPFADRSFDVVLAVECIFHFPSRLEFMQEARAGAEARGALGTHGFRAI
jgi:cyclopropane fatty-acyl-phospholipid synthase-like methyltransferase